MKEMTFICSPALRTLQCIDIPYLLQKHSLQLSFGGVRMKNRISRYIGENLMVQMEMQFPEPWISFGLGIRLGGV